MRRQEPSGHTEQSKQPSGHFRTPSGEIRRVIVAEAILLMGKLQKIQGITSRDKDGCQLIRIWGDEAAADRAAKETAAKQQHSGATRAEQSRDFRTDHEERGKDRIDNWEKETRGRTAYKYTPEPTPQRFCEGAHHGLKEEVAERAAYQMRREN